ncbi:Maf family protein [Nakamurella lactea]|uniref:Maf family protein n=1 Tax=Nakamurella lactea TaxID=459515 RepID=UPI00048F999B|nr:Maf family protein [Nakamurella lactea]
MSTTPAVVLASASPARLSVLRAAGIDPVVIVSEVDEPAIERAHAGEPPADVVAELAMAKAQAVAARATSRFQDAVVIGCDSMLLFGGTLRGKPGTAENARRQWAEMAGGEGDLLTGHAVLRVNHGEITGSARGTEKTTIRLGSPTAAEVDAYLATGEPLQVAGSLTIDGYGGWFVDGIDGDPSSVIGISLPLIRRLLQQLDLTVTDLWRPTPVATSASAEGATP